MMTLALLLVALTTQESMRSSEVAVRHGSDAVVRYRARIEDDFLIITATHEKGWHTYAMDNELRALTALEGAPSLGVEQGVEIQAGEGIELSGPWLQTKPSDLSKPELRWFSYGFDQTALFARRVKEVNSDTVLLRIRGQACSGETCCQVNVTLKLHATNESSDRPGQAEPPQTKTLLRGLVPVKTQSSETTSSDDSAPTEPSGS